MDCLPTLLKWYDLLISFICLWQLKRFKDFLLTFWDLPLSHQRDHWVLRWSTSVLFWDIRNALDTRLAFALRVARIALILLLVQLRNDLKNWLRPLSLWSYWHPYRWWRKLQVLTLSPRSIIIQNLRIAAPLIVYLLKGLSWALFWLIKVPAHQWVSILLL